MVETKKCLVDRTVCQCKIEEQFASQKNIYVDVIFFENIAILLATKSKVTNSAVNTEEHEWRVYGVRYREVDDRKHPYVHSPSKTISV